MISIRRPFDRRQVLAALAGLAVTPAGAEWRVGNGQPLAFSVQDREGRALPGASLYGRLTLVHFWASWCVSCREEFPALQALQAEMGSEGLRILAISLDRLGWPAIDRTVQTLGIDGLALYHDLNREAARALSVAALPTTLVVDVAGRERWRHAGTVDWALPEVRSRLREVLAGAGTPRDATAARF